MLWERGRYLGISDMMAPASWESLPLVEYSKRGFPTTEIWQKLGALGLPRPDDSAPPGGPDNRTAGTVLAPIVGG